MAPKPLSIAFGLLLSIATAVTAQQYDPSEPKPPMTGTVGNDTIAGNGPEVLDNGKYQIEAEGIRMLFVPYGASISNLFITDSHGEERDIVLGWDNATFYTEDESHPHYGGVPGRYANRIKNATFSLNGETYRVPANENADDPEAKDALHGGEYGWDWRNFTVTTHTRDSITFSIVDPDGTQGFPGQVISYITYTARPYTWHLRMVALATEKETPIMLTSHTYWNLDGFQNPTTATAENHTLHLPYSGQRISVDGNLIPTGSIANNAPHSVNDFHTAPKQIGANLTAPQAEGNCGTDCTGYDTCYLINRDAQGPYDWETKGPVASLASAWSGIKVDVFTDQEAFQVYTCNTENGTTPIKGTQGAEGRARTVPQFGCVVMEVQDWIDGINYPEWGRGGRQVFGPGSGAYELNARYEFSVGGTDGGMYMKEGNGEGQSGEKKKKRKSYR
ncbi:MAG: hypothetical protein M1831_003803 [Alyxoria varia]|nr:MAG: hypothetical protein M1831_003803 [Alyxoria varia]